MSEVTEAISRAFLRSALVKARDIGEATEEDGRIICDVCANQAACFEIDEIDKAPIVMCHSCCAHVGGRCVQIGTVMRHLLSVAEVLDARLSAELVMTNPMLTEDERREAILKLYDGTAEERAAASQRAFEDAEARRVAAEKEILRLKDCLAAGREHDREAAKLYSIVVEANGEAREDVRRAEAERDHAAAELEKFQREFALANHEEGGAMSEARIDELRAAVADWKRRAADTAAGVRDQRRVPAELAAALLSEALDEIAHLNVIVNDLARAENDRRQR